MKLRTQLLTGFLLIAASLGAQPFYRRFIAPNFSAPPTCDATSKGYIYLDTDDNSLNYCNGTSYQAIATGAGFDLTADHTFTGLNTFARVAADPDACFNAASGVAQSICVGESITFEGAAVDTEDAILSTNGNAGLVLGTGSGTLTNAIALMVSSRVNMAFISGQVDFAPASDSTPMNGSDTFSTVAITTPSLNHTGAGNTLNGLKINAITADADATENAIFIGAGWDRGIDIGIAASNTEFAIRMADAARVRWNGQAVIQYSNGSQLTTVDADGNFGFFAADGGEYGSSIGTLITVVGAAQNVDPDSVVIHIAAGGAASVATISDPPNTAAERVTFICNDGNVTFTNADAGAANTLDLAGSFTCSAQDTITVVYDTTNDRWVEVARSVN